MDERMEQIAGLRLLADFLEGHTTIPVPGLHAVNVTSYSQAADWVDGLDAIVFDHGPSADLNFQYVTRRFAGLSVRGWIKAEYVSRATARYEAVTQLQPLTPRQVIDGYEAAVRGVPVEDLPVIEATEHHKASGF